MLEAVACSEVSGKVVMRVPVEERCSMRRAMMVDS